MSRRIQPRPIFRNAMRLLQDARCPECGRAFDPVQDAEDYCPRMALLHCNWCSQRQILLHEFRAWQQQDATLARSKARHIHHDR